jgi:YD repeat-containing protein
VQSDDNVAVYDASNAVLWSTKTAGNAATADITTHFTYKPGGQIDTVKDSMGNTWSYDYDLQGRVVSQTDPDWAATSHYDDLGRLDRTTDARKQTLSFTYDLLGRRKAKYSGDDTTDPEVSP